MKQNGLLPWYQRTYRWGQTNITEIDPIRYDIEWWRKHWSRTRVQGVIINAGGIVAYYPSQYPLHYRAEHLGDRDLFGDLMAAAREEGLAVLARMDSNRATEAFYQTRPDWFTQDREGNPYKAGDRYVACVNSAYYDEYLPDILREVIDRYHPEGFTDNSWSGLQRNHICYCENCRQKFYDAYSSELPRASDWDDVAYRQWIQWNYNRRLEIWDLNNRVTTTAGGPDCLWLGMNSGNIYEQCLKFRDYKGICERSQILMLDFQGRNNTVNFQHNGDAGKLIHGLLGWEKIIPESMAMYQGFIPTFRLCSKPQAEARHWMIEGFAGTIQPWWHHISAYHEDRRQYRTAEPLLRWYETNQEYLINRRPVATIGVVWSQQNIDFYGRDQAKDRTILPYNGMIQALIRARIPYLPVHADHIEREAGQLDVLILPNVGSLSESQIRSIRHFVEQGGGLIASGESSLYDEWGERRPDFALKEIFGVHASGESFGSIKAATPSWEEYDSHTYLRLTPELRGQVYGPKMGTEPAITGTRHPVLNGFDETDILPFGGRIEVVQREEEAEIPVTLIPAFPIFPPETSWMRQPTSSTPALVLKTTAAGGRVAYLPADIDRCFGRYNLPDHGNLLENIIRWVANDRIPLKVDGPGLIDCHLYCQPGRLILHVINLINAATWRPPVHELIPLGPFKISLQLPEDVAATEVKYLVSGRTAKVSFQDGWVIVEISSITDHEVLVIS